MLGFLNNDWQVQEHLTYYVNLDDKLWVPSLTKEKHKVSLKQFYRKNPVCNITLRLIFHAVIRHRNHSCILDFRIIRKGTEWQVFTL